MYFNFIQCEALIILISALPPIHSVVDGVQYGFLPFYLLIDNDRWFHIGRESIVDHFGVFIPGYSTPVSDAFYR